jgi:glycosyltransferase involved in cell wall biosynthesis
MVKSRTPTPDYDEPVIYVHAKGREKIAQSDARALLELGLPLCSRMAYKGWNQTVNGYDQVGKLIAEMAVLFPARPVIFMKAGLQIKRQQIDELLELANGDDQPAAMTVLSNAEDMVNPFAGLKTTMPERDGDFPGLVRLLAPGHLHRLNRWHDHFGLLSTRLVTLLAQRERPGTLMQDIIAVGGSLNVADHLFVVDSQKPVVSALKLEPYEKPCPPPFGELSARIQNWFNAGIDSLPLVSGPGQAATLHITHSWGGGVAQWIKSFISTDSKRQHFQLRSENPQTGLGFGQRLSLYAGNELSCPIASWWLKPAISSVTGTHEEYREILAEICRRYGIGKILISSLIGHSLDALRSGLPSLQILHDHFPLWPLLSVNPQPYLLEGGLPNLEQALADHKGKLEFSDKSAAEWLQLGGEYVHALKAFKVKIAAPGQSVLDLQARLSPGFGKLTTNVIPHGFPVMKNLHAVQPRAREDGRLRMVVLGRIQTGKGAGLLAGALPELAEHVQIYLLGTGKPGEAFFGTPGVDVILEYNRDELVSILGKIGPHFAALLSVVPETYSFTLSELQQMRIPVLATRLGSFPSRIEDNKTGWLIDAEPQALISRVASLAGSPEQIEAVRSNLTGVKTSTPKTMVAAYNRFCRLQSVKKVTRPLPAATGQIQLAAKSFENTQLGNELQNAIRQRTELTKEVEQRTAWALDANKRLKVEKQRCEELTSEAEERTRWALDADKRLKVAQQRHEELRKEAEERTAWALDADKRLEVAQQRCIELTKEVEERTAWALDADKRLKLEQQRRTEWVGKLEVEQQRLRQMVADRQTQLEFMEKQLQLADMDYSQLEEVYGQLKTYHEQLNADHHYLAAQHQQLIEQHQQLKDEHHRLYEDLQHLQLIHEQLERDRAQLRGHYEYERDQKALILGSLSWRLTKPLRAGRRVLRNLKRARA